MCYIITTSVSGPQRNHLDSLKSRVSLPKIARTAIVVWFHTLPVSLSHTAGLSEGRHLGVRCTCRGAHCVFVHNDTHSTVQFYNAHRLNLNGPLHIATTTKSPKTALQIRILEIGFDVFQAAQAVPCGWVPKERVPCVPPLEFGGAFLQRLPHLSGPHANLLSASWQFGYRVTKGEERSCGVAAVSFNRHHR
jgi:hypothetical protein